MLEVIKVLEFILALLAKYHYAIIFPLAVLEGPMIAVLSGFFISRGLLLIIPAFLILLLGDLVGDTFYYTIGRFGGEKFVEKWGKFFLLNVKDLEAFKKKFNENVWKILLTSKFTQLAGLLALVSAGIARVNFLKFLGIVTVASGLKIFLFLLIGYYFGAAYEKIYQYYGSYSAIIAFVVIFLLFWGTYFLFQQRRKSDI